MKPCILFHRGTPWNGTIRGSTNILADQFLRNGHKIVWMGPVRHIGQSMLRSERRTQFKQHTSGVLEIMPYSTMPMMRNRIFPGVVRKLSSRLAYQSCLEDVKKIIAGNIGYKPDVVWTAGGDAGLIKTTLGASVSILHSVDIHEAYAGPNIIPLEILDCRACDHVVAIGHALRQFLIERRFVPKEKISVIGQGADLSQYSSKLKQPTALNPACQPRLCWLGLIEKADPTLIRAALEALPHGTGSLVLIGPVSPWAAKLARTDDRVILTGPMLPTEAANALMHCRVGLMLYDQTRNALQYQGQNPLKLYEMAAAGLPIVSTPHSEFDFSCPPILIAQTREEVVRAVQHALVEHDDLSRRSRLFAEANDWKLRFEQANVLIERLLAGTAVRNEAANQPARF